MSESTDERDACHGTQTIGRYANCFKVGYNAVEVVLEFGEQYTDGAASGVHTRIVTNPFCARALLATLDGALAAQAQQVAAVPGSGATDEHR